MFIVERETTRDYPDRRNADDASSQPGSDRAGSAEVLPADRDRPGQPVRASLPPTTPKVDRGQRPGAGRPDLGEDSQPGADRRGESDSTGVPGGADRAGSAAGAGDPGSRRQQDRPGAVDDGAVGDTGRRIDLRGNRRRVAGQVDHVDAVRGGTVRDDAAPGHHDPVLPGGQAGAGIGSQDRPGVPSQRPGAPATAKPRLNTS